MATLTLGFEFGRFDVGVVLETKWHPRKLIVDEVGKTWAFGPLLFGYTDRTKVMGQALKTYFENLAQNANSGPIVSPGSTALS